MTLSPKTTGSKGLLLIIADGVYQEKQKLYKTVYKQNIACMWNTTVERESKTHELTVIETKQSKTSKS